MLGTAVSSKGQVTIPLAIRKSLGLKPGDRVAFVSEGENALVIPLHGGDFMKLKGALKGYVKTKVTDQEVKEAAMKAALARDERSRRR